MEKREVLKKFYDLGLDIIKLKANDKVSAGKWKIKRHLSVDNLNKWKGNYGVVLGNRSNNMVVVDLDQEELFKFFKDVNTLIVKTPKKGYHLYFKSKKEQKKVPSFMGKPIDIQGNGSYVVIPPSTFDNKQYEIYNDAPILEVGDVERFVKDKLKTIIFDKTVDCRKAVKEFLGEPENDFDKYTQYFCPFHNDGDTPSLTVYEDGLNCFGCGWSGNFEMFLQKKEGKSPVEIKKYLESQGYSVSDDVEFKIETKKEKQLRLFSEQIDKDFTIVRDVESYDLFLYVESHNAYILLTEVMLAKLLFEEYSQRVSLKDCKNLMDYFVSNIRSEDKDWVSFLNKVVNVETLEERKPGADIFTKYHFEYNYNPKAYSERFDTVIKEILIGDDGNEDKYNLFFEMIGYFFTNHNRYNKMFFITGEGGNGKSTLMDLINIIFKNYKASSDFHKLSEPFGLESLLHKLVNVLPDLSNKSLTDTSVIKAITGGDSVIVNRKYKSPVDIVLPCKFVATGNYLPKTKEDGYAFFRRVIHVELTNTFKDNPEMKGDKKSVDVRAWLPHDIQGIEWLIYKSIKAYNKVKLEGWSVQKDISEVQDNYMKLSNPVLWVVKNCFKKDPDYDTFYSNKDIVTIIKRELRKHGLPESGNNKVYYEAMRDCGAVETTESSMGQREKGFIGLMRIDDYLNF